MKLLSLRKARRIEREILKRYPTLKRRLSPSLIQLLQTHIEALHTAIDANDRAQATQAATDLHLFLKEHGRKTFFDHIREFVIAIGVAIAVAGVIRQMWFEPYEIPTGSMRPTFREQDKVVVMKDAFGINTPFQTSHLLFNPEAVQRGNFIVLSGDGLDIASNTTNYFGIFPGIKRYVKRNVALPGDTLYFYGGMLYGLDASGQPIADFSSGEAFKGREYIPFISLDGTVTATSSPQGRTFTISHMHTPVGETTISKASLVQSKAFDGTEWTTKLPLSFMPLWGMQNFGQARLLLPSELPREAIDLGYANKGAMGYLEIKHDPTLPTEYSLSGRRQNETSLLHSELSWLSLEAPQIDALARALYTSRFVVRNGMAHRYDYADQPREGIFLGQGIPDGTYEFFGGTACSIGWGGYASELPPTHPIYPHTVERLKALYNCGIELSPMTLITAHHRSSYFPSRYAYFREGALYSMGAPVYLAGSPSIGHFLELEKRRQVADSGYLPFVDHGLPTADTITRYGLKIPPKHYFGLGDNHSMSLDSRFFGPIPEANIQGSPTYLVLPPGPRWGIIEQPPIPFWRIENLYVGIALVIGIGGGYIVAGRRTRWKRYQRQTHQLQELNSQAC